MEALKHYPEAQEILQTFGRKWRQEAKNMAKKCAKSMLVAKIMSLINITIVFCIFSASRCISSTIEYVKCEDAPFPTFRQILEVCVLSGGTQKYYYYIFI